MESAGEKLKKIRLEKGISLEEVQKKTKIRLNILKAIEGDSISGLSPIYLKSFLKIYCKFLGLDPKEYVPDYKEIQAKFANPPAISPVTLKAGSGTANKFFKVSGAIISKLIAYRPSKKVKKALKVVIMIAVLYFLLFNLGKFISSRKRNQQAAPKQRAARVISKKEIPFTAAVPAKPKAKAIPASPKPQAQITPAVTKTELPSDIRLGIRAKENCWLQLKVDGKVVFQRVLQKGRYEAWQANDKMELSLGNAGVVELEVNGQVFSNLGKKGQALKNIIITKEGLKIK